jgi:hypothetical protein
MSDNRHYRMVIGLGAAAGGLFVAALCQLAGAPSAQADNITDVIDSIQATDAVGQTLLGEAGTFFSSSDVPDGLASEFTGLDDTLFGAQYDLLVNGYADLQGIDGPYSYETFGLLPTPTDLATTSTDVTQYFDYAQSSLTAAATDFGTSDFGAGLGELTNATEDYVAASQIELIGLTDTLLGLGQQ